MVRDELGGRIMNKFLSRGPKIYSYKNDNVTEVKSTKNTKNEWKNVKSVLLTTKIAWKGSRHKMKQSFGSK